jgi:hypothetical protein
VAKVSLEDLRKGAAVTRKERVHPLCLRGDLVAEVDALTSELSSLRVAEVTDNAPPMRVGQRVAPREKAVEDRLAKLVEELDDSTGDLRLRALPNGEWRRWLNDHPPREGDERDEQLGFGLCNTDDLANDLHLWALSWNGDDLDVGDWDRIFAPNAAGGDLKQLVSLVVTMQEVGDDPKWRLRALRGAQTSSDVEASPEQ